MIMTLSARHAGDRSACRDENVMIIAKGFAVGAALRSGADRHRQGSHTTQVDPAVPGRLPRQRQIREPADQRRQRHPTLEPGQSSAQAVVDAGAEVWLTAIA